jgi:hypothetical protein
METELELVRSLRKGIEKEADCWPRNNRAYRKQLEKIRGEVKEIVLKETRSYCNCRTITPVCSADWREFLKDMNTPCAVHGVRRLGIIVSVTGYPEDADPADLDFKRVLGEYQRRMTALQNQEAQ